MQGGRGGRRRIEVSVLITQNPDDEMNLNRVECLKNGSTLAGYARLLDASSSQSSRLHTGVHARKTVERVAEEERATDVRQAHRGSPTQVSRAPGYSE